MRPGLPFLLLVSLLAAGCAAPEPEPRTLERLPRSVAALGDSITTAANAAGDTLGDRPAASWATGSAADVVESQYERLLRLEAGIRNQAHNLAASGARVSDLDRQAEEAVRLRAQLVVVLIGANDACASSVDRMTSAEAFLAAFRVAAERLEEDLPEDAVVYVVSIPDATRLWDLFRDDPQARAVWRAYGVCRSVLAENATDADRAAVRERIEAYNAVMRGEAEARGFHHDGGAVFREEVRREDVSTLDYFHPSLSGQARLAEVAWRAGPYAGWPAAS